MDRIQQRHFFGPFLAPTESALVVSILGHEIHIVDLRCNGNSDAMSLVCAVGFLFQKEQKVDSSKAHKNPGFVKSVWVCQVSLFIEGWF